jgi:hypothetical protein
MIYNIEIRFFYLTKNEVEFGHDILRGYVSLYHLRV